MVRAPAEVALQPLAMEIAVAAQMVATWVVEEGVLAAAAAAAATVAEVVELVAEVGIVLALAS